jgi:hypothetical protein
MLLFRQLLKPFARIQSVLILVTAVAQAQELFTQKGTDPTFKELLAGKKIPLGLNSNDGVKGSTVKVNNRFVETTAEAKRRIPRDINIHTLGNSFIRRDDFEKWSRWYQEAGNTQVFRLFTGEVNVRNEREKAARIEAYSHLQWQRGPWQEWTGVYTLVKPHGAAIFQAKNGENDWSVQINTNDKGDVILNHRRDKDKVIARNMTGKPFLIMVRDNGHDYEVHLNGTAVGSGNYARPHGTTTFRWGMYVGGNDVKHDAMIFVSGATIRSNVK